MNITVTILWKESSQFTNNVFLKKRSKFLDCFCHDNFCKIYHNDKKFDIFHNTKISTLIHVSVFVVHEIKKNCWLFKTDCFYLLFQPVVCSGFSPCYSRQYTVVCSELHPSPYIHLEATGQAETHLSNENAEVLEQLMHELHVHHNMQVCCIGITLNVKLHFFLNYKVHFA